MATRRRLRRMSIALALLFSGTAMASTPPMPSAAALAGCWRVTAENAPASTCEVELRSEPSAVGHALTLGRGCVVDPLLARVTGWRPAPDGISFAGADRLSVLFFSRHAPDRYVARKDGRTWVLTPEPR